MRKSWEGLMILIIYSFLICTIWTGIAQDTISFDQSIRDGENETVVSADESFELGFFSPGQSESRYLGIWYKKVSSGTVVWVANRDAPLSDQSGVLSITLQGVLVLLNSTNDTVWSSNASRTAQNPVAVLLDSGNLVVKDENDDNNPDNFLWQSFDYPCDTLLPGMKLGINLVTGLNRFLSSWKNIDDPAQGDFQWKIDLSGFPQLFLRKGSVIQFRAGSWNGLHWTGAPTLKPNSVYTYEFIWNQKEVFFRFEILNSSVPSRLMVSPSGVVQRFTWIDRTQRWTPYAAIVSDQCDNYALCGAYASCNINNPPTVCGCLNGFIPRSPRDWSILVWSDGCVRRTPLNCSENGDGFLKLSAVKLPDTSHSWVDKSINLLECEKMCFDNCTCKAYANLDVRDGGSGCLLWFGDLIDIRDYSDSNSGQDLYVRMAASELGKIRKGSQSNEKRHVVIIVTSVISATGVLLLGWIVYMWKKKLRNQGRTDNSHELHNKDEDSRKEEMELPMFDLTTIANATDNFSNYNKLGEGGFGPVYKGKLIEGQEIAVKRLSTSSGQGMVEFKNEVLLIAKLQHRNLVKLLGCCIHKDERMLIYEYMPNKSLDFFIFDEKRSKLLDWSKRIHIIGGIARGLLYLHQDSRLRIIHRDLKASNILLDNDMNPKISDFGMARTFWEDQTVANTNQIAGTYGYISPEYAVDGLFSMKSDVFSFGVLVLEIASGKRNRGFYHPDHNHNLLGHAWKLWMEGRPGELIDESLDDYCPLPEILRCIHVGLLCVQQAPEDRPITSTVVLMLGGERSLPQPKQPGFFTERNLPNSESSSSRQKFSSTNEITFSLLEAR